MTTVEIVTARPIVEIVAAPARVVEVPTGMRGLSAYQVAVNNGFAGTEAEWLASLSNSHEFVHIQSTPSSSWSITHGIGRLPMITVYVAGAKVLDDSTATTTTASIQFPTPTAGYAVLT